MEVTVHSQIVLHIKDDGAETRRLLVSAITYDPEQHSFILKALKEARRKDGVRVIDDERNPLGRWRVTDVPVCYRMDESDLSYNHVFELEESNDDYDYEHRFAEHEHG